MTSTELIILFCILLIIFIYLWFLHNPPVRIVSNFMNDDFIKSTQTIDSNAEGFKDSNDSLIEGLGIGPVIQANANLPLSQYMIMGAYNATFDGTRHSLDQLTKVLTAGCRFIDLEIRVDDKGMPIISQEQTMKNTNQKPLQLKDVLDLVINSSMMGSTDPLFLHFRVYITDKIVSRSDFYNTLGSTLQTELGPRLYNGKVTKDTLFSDIQGKIIMAADMTLIPDMASYPATCYTGVTCASLPNLINSATGTNYWNKMDYETVSGIPPIVMADNTVAMPPNNSTPNLAILVPPSSTLPDKTYNNPSPIDLHKMVVLSGVQTVLFMWYQKDTGNNELQFYNSLFSNLAAAFVPMAQAIPFIKENYKLQAGAQTANYPN